MNKRQVGSGYEKKAGVYLQEQGYRILQYNFRSRQGEIDIVARDGRYLVFVEVKYRADGRNGDPLEAVDLRKQKTIILTAQYYLARYRLSPQTPCRFDVVAIQGDQIRLVKNAFLVMPAI